jgi:hypothetical protein
MTLALIDCQQWSPKEEVIRLCLGMVVFGFVFSSIFFDFCDILISDFKVRVFFQCEKNSNLFLKSTIICVNKI